MLHYFLVPHDSCVSPPGTLSLNFIGSRKRISMVDPTLDFLFGLNYFVFTPIPCLILSIRSVYLRRLEFTSKFLRLGKSLFMFLELSRSCDCRFTVIPRFSTPRTFGSLLQVFRVFFFFFFKSSIGFPVLFSVFSKFVSSLHNLSNEIDVTLFT